MSDTSEVIQIKRNPQGFAHHLWERYEKQDGCDYARLWALAQANAPRAAMVPVQRLEYVDIFSTKNERIAEWRDWIAQEEQSDEMRYKFLEQVLPHIDAELASYFGSEYMPLFLRFYANTPEDDKPYAAGWHCDAGPRKHLKLLLYLNDSEESGGNTEFLDHDTTMRLDETGYLFCDLDSRVDDLTGLCSEYGIPYAPIRRPIQAGQGVLFEPAQIMHRAVWPTRGTRYMAQICFLPSPFPWTAACEHLGMPFRDNRWRKFPWR